MQLQILARLTLQVTTIIYHHVKEKEKRKKIQKKNMGN